MRLCTRKSSYDTSVLRGLPRIREETKSDQKQHQKPTVSRATVQAVHTHIPKFTGNKLKSKYVETQRLY